MKNKPKTHRNEKQKQQSDRVSEWEHKYMYTNKQHVKQYAIIIIESSSLKAPNIVIGIATAIP